MWIAATAIGVGLLGVVLGALGPAAANSSRVAQGSSEGWQTVFSETFNSPLAPGWEATDASSTDGGEYHWGGETFTYTSPITGVWCVGDGADGVSLTAGTDVYPDNVDSWLTYGPIELTDVWDAYMRFSWWLETGGVQGGEGLAAEFQTVERAQSAPEDGDWLGWCILSDPDDLEACRGTYVSGSIGRWLSGAVPLGTYLPATSSVTNTVWIAFHFTSDNDGVAGRGAFVDDVELRVNRGYRVALPLVRKDPAPPVELLRNGGFEADWGEEESHRVIVFPVDNGPYETEVGNIFTPPGWLTWFRHDPDTWDQPEVHDMAGATQEIKQYRVRTGNSAMVVFTFFRKHDAGFLQQVDVEPGTRLRASAFAHAWSNDHNGPHPDDGLWSEGPGYDCGFALEGEAPDTDWENFTFWVGVDPTGGIDPYADTVVWGDGAHIYNCYHKVPSVEAEAQAHKVTVFLRSQTLWRFKHNDAYWDDVELTVIDGGGQQMEWTYPLVEGGAKVGVHSLRPNEVGAFVQGLADGGTRFPVVKGVDDLGWLSGVKEASPETIIVARRTSPIEGAPNVEDGATDLDEMARALMSFVLDKITWDPRLRGVVDYWEVVNEPDPPGPEGYRQLSQLMIKCMDLAEKYGLKLALFSFNAGTPEWDEMEAMVETGVFDRAREGGHILALHEGTFVSHDPQEGWGQTIPGSPEVEGAGALNFRYRYLYHLLKQRGEVVPLVVSEWYCGDEQSASTETLVDALKWYDGEASEDYYFWAAGPFTLGPTSGWGHTDYERVYEGGLLDYMIEIKDRQNAAPLVQSSADNLPSGLRRR